MLAALCSLILLLTAPAIFAENTSDTAQLTDQINSLKKNLTQDKTQKAKLTANLEATESAMGRLAESLRRMEQKIHSQTLLLQDLQQQKVVLNQQIDQQRIALAAHIRSLYLLGKESYSKMLLNQDNVNAIEKNLTYFSYIHQSRRKVIRDLENTFKALQDNEQQIQHQTHNLVQLSAELTAEQDQLLEEKKMRAALLLKMNAQIEAKTQRLHALEENKRQLQAIVNHLQKAVVEESHETLGAGFNSLKQSLPWPTQGEIINHYGAPIEHSDLTWNGILIKADEGQSVYAVHSGKVIFANWLKGFGMLLIIDHADGYMTLYGRNQSIYRQVGDIVKSGDLVAAVGQSGGYDESGLYFELRRDGRPEDPERWFYH